MICGIHLSAKKMNGKCIYCRKAELALMKILEAERNFMGGGWFTSHPNRQPLEVTEPCSSEGRQVMENDRKRERERLQSQHEKAWYTRWHKNVEELRTEL